MIRGLDTADFPSVRMRAESLAAALYPELIPDIAREHTLLRTLLFDANAYVRAVGPMGAPTAVLIARTGTNIWALRRHATILLWYSSKAGAGAALLRDFRDWTDTQKHVVVAGFVDDFDADDRILRIVKRVGFIQRGGAYLYFPKRS